MSTNPDYALIAIMVLIAVGMAGGILVLMHVIMPMVLKHWRTNPVKHDTYESGVDPFGDTRRRFNVRFYLIAVLFLVFDVEIIVLWPFAVLFRDLAAANRVTTEESATGLIHGDIANNIIASGYSMSYVLLTVGFFSLLLIVGLIYEWRKGVFKWA
jgi:NADH-quinone oxidoreductase subunit A